MDIQPQLKVLTCFHGHSRAHERWAEIRSDERSRDPRSRPLQPFPQSRDQNWPHNSARLSDTLSPADCLKHQWWEWWTHSHNSQNGRETSQFCSGSSHTAAAGRIPLSHYLSFWGFKSYCSRDPERQPLTYASPTNSFMFISCDSSK